MVSTDETKTPDHKKKYMSHFMGYILFKKKSLYGVLKNDCKSSWIKWTQGRFQKGRSQQSNTGLFWFKGFSVTYIIYGEVSNYVVYLQIAVWFPL